VGKLLINVLAGKLLIQLVLAGKLLINIKP